MKRTFLAAVAVLASAGALAAQAPAPDPRVDQALNTNVISQIERSVQFERTLVPLEQRKPQVDRTGLLEVREGVFIDRNLAPRVPTRDDEDAVRIFRKDAR